MSISQFITKCRTCKAYWRGLIVRAVEDAIILFIIGVVIWSVCWFASGIFHLLGVC